MDGASGRPAWFLLTRHWLSLVGTALVTTAGISWLFVLPLHISGRLGNPYIGIVTFLILPVVFFAGLALIPIGVFLSRRSIEAGLSSAEFDRKAALHRLAWFFGITTFMNVLIGTQVTYRAVAHMETPQFCGATCHAMRPEFAAFQHSPHSSLECVQCHVSPGAAGWLASKASGTRQLFEQIADSYAKPVPPALESNRLVPARETCENCHWAERFGSVRLRVITHYAEDEQNSRSQTVLMMMVGGSKFAGIHGSHFGPGIHIRFAVADRSRQTIPWIEYQNTVSGKTERFVDSSSAADSHPTLATYEMQCVDCHNRPAHTFESPERGVDNALVLGDISASLPFIKKESVELLKAEYSTQAEAGEKLPHDLAGFYEQNYPDVYKQRIQDINQAAQTVLAIYHRNVFPDLKVTWGTYPNNLGHMDFPGCFRCHDGSHTAGDGKTITQDCNACHEPLAMDEASPEILRTLGIEKRLSEVRKQ